MITSLRGGRDRGRSRLARLCSPWQGVYLGLGLILTLAAPGLSQPQSTIRHDMRVVITPAQHAFSVDDTITFPVAAEHPAVSRQVLTPAQRE